VVTRQSGEAQLHVDVRDVDGAPVANATVTFMPAGGVTKISLAFDKASGSYVAAAAPVGRGMLQASHPRFQDQRSELWVTPPVARELLILAALGAKTYFRAKTRMPVNADADLIGVAVVPGQDGARSDLIQLANELGLVEDKQVSDLAVAAGIRLYRARSGSSELALARLSNAPFVQHAGSVVSRRAREFSFLTRDVVVRFRSSTTEAAREIARSMSYALVREVVYSPFTYVLRWDEPASLALLDSTERLAAMPGVEWAEPNLICTPQVDAIVPADALWPGQWNHELVGTENAWQALEDAGLPAFGSPDVVLAIWDTGVQSAGGAPTNDDFSGPLTDGSAKVASTFDFVRMVANNDQPWLDHGSAVAGIAAALAKEPSGPGEYFGMVGAAPNVRIMTLVAPTMASDLVAADQFVWMAGFDPGSTAPGFPAPPAQGADIINCCLALGVDAPLSGTARAALDFVTTFGRAGKGVLCFFSTGNEGKDNRLARPWGAYEKCFAIAATMVDQAQEVRAPYSGWGQITLSAPSNNNSTVHNPPGSLMTWGAAHQGKGNLVSYPVTETTLTAASAIGATTLAVASVDGLAAGAVIHIGVVGQTDSEPARVVSVDASASRIDVLGFDGASGTFTGGLLYQHASQEALVSGPANHRNNFGGTSSATPLAAGVAALVLSANPTLTFLQARQILGDTAVKVDTLNADPIGRWLDADGNPAVNSGLPPVWSSWYGFGRVDAEKAVKAALSVATSADLVIRDDLTDTGAVPSTAGFADSPDIWCRRTDPALDPTAFPADYDIAGPHESPLRGQMNWICARVHNRGSSASLDAWIRVSVSHFPGLEFTYPDSFRPRNGPNQPLPTPTLPGTYFIGEAKVSGIAPGSEQIVSLQWPAELIPPATVATPAGEVQWHPCLLAEVSPHDGPAATGAHVWDDSNLAQKNISIVNVVAGTNFAIGTVIGHENNAAEFLVLKIARGTLPADVVLFVGPLGADRGPDGALRSPSAVPSPPPAWHQALSDGLGATPPRIVLLDPKKVVEVRVPMGPGRLSPLVIGGIVGEHATPGSYDILLTQIQPSGRRSGSAALSLTVLQAEPL
jgi:hypothetical protein